MPTVGVKGGLVTIRYPRVKVGDWPDYRLQSSAEITLNPSIPWDIEIRGGASRFVADLRGLRLGSFSVHGGAGRLEVTLPAPSGTVPVNLFGGVSNVAVHRPEGVSARLRVAGGVTHLRFDERHIGAAGGELDLRSRNYEGSTGRYDVTVTGGANNMSIDCERNVSLDR